MAQSSHEPADHDAERHLDGDYMIGSMPIEEQRSTFDFFIGLTKWGSLIIAAMVLFLTLLTSTGAGWIGSAAATAVLLVAGVFMLRGKNDAETH